jgi:hypothetical protein
MRYKRIDHHSHTRILALDLHPRRFGYVVMESPGKLLDWGVRRSYRKIKHHPEVLVGGRLRSLLKIWMPDVVVTQVGKQRNTDVHALFREIRREVGDRFFLPMRSSQEHFGGRSKYHRAVEIAARFPEIGRKLPAQRKFWEGEHYSMSIFEALGIAASYIS